MKKIMTILFGAGLISISMTTFSQSILKIGHVDIAEILAALPERDSAAIILGKETKEIQSTEKVATDNGFTYILDVSKGSVVFTSKDSQNINQLVLKILKPL